MENSAAHIYRPCPLCETRESRTYLRKQNMTLVQCPNCSMIYASPVPADMVAGTFYDKLGIPFYLSPDKLDSDYANVRFERELRLFRRFCKEGEVLDVGCSTGAFLYQLRTRFPDQYEVLGIEISKPALDYARSRGVDMIEHSFPDFDFGNRQFAAIAFWAVMEHLVDAKVFLAKAARLLQPGGHCFILVPNLKSLAVKILETRYRYILPQHVNYFTAQTLEKFARNQSSLEIVASGSMHFNPLVIWQDSRGKGEFVSDEQRGALLKRTTSHKQNPLFKPIKWVYKGAENFLSAMNLADNLFLVLRKK